MWFPTIRSTGERFTLLMLSTCQRRAEPVDTAAHNLRRGLLNVVCSSHAIVESPQPAGTGENYFFSFIVRRVNRRASLDGLVRMMAMKFRLFLGFSIIMALPLIINSRPRFRVIEVGQFHGDEIHARSGERWLGLFVSGRRSALRYSTINVTKVFDDITDYGTGQKTGKRVRVNSPRQPLLLASNSTALTPGPLITAFKMKEGDYSYGLDQLPLMLRLGHRSYVLKVVAPDQKAQPCPDINFPRNGRLVLISGHSQQVLYTLDVCGNDPNWYLVWAGDLDRDGKLDLYVNVTQHYDLSERKLFLSSQARRGKLVREVGSFETGGC